MGALGLGFGVGEAAARVPPVALRALGGCCALPRGVLAPEGASGGTRTPAFHGVRWDASLDERD